MTTIVNIKTDSSISPKAKGDGQISIADIITVSGSPIKDVVTTNGTFGAGDVGKFIAITGCGVVGGNGNTHFTTIASVPGQRHITLTAAANNTLSGSSQTLEWGSDDAAAFVSFRTVYQGQSDIELDCPQGRYCLVATDPISGGSTCAFYGVLGVHVLSSDGNSTRAVPKAVFTDMLGCGAGMFVGGCRTAMVNGAGSFSSLIHTVNAGSSTVSLITPSEASIFTVGKYVEIAGFEVQAFGQPTNPYFYEYHKITNISGGVITLDAPLKYRYNENWPDFTTSDVPSGQPRIYLTNENQLSGPGVNGGVWDCVHIYEGIGWEFWDSSGAIFNQFTGRDITVKNGYSGAHTVPICSGCLNYVVDGTDLSISPNSEFDKQVVNATWKNLTASGFTGQSPSPDVMTFDNVHVIGPANGTGKTCVVQNGCVFDNAPVFGPESYGTAANTNSLIARDSAFNSGIGFGMVPIDNSYTISNGIITFPHSDGPPQWAVPGAWIVSSGLVGHAIYGPAFQVLDVTQSGGTCTITTSHFSLISGMPSKVRTIAAPQMTMTNCTGSEEALSWSNCAPLQTKNTRWNRTYSGNIGTTLPVINVCGKILSVTFTVTSGYSAGTFNLDSPFVVQMSDDTVLVWGPSIDLTQAQTRTVTYNAGSDTYSYSSSFGSDSFHLPGSGKIWMFDDQMTPKMSGAVGSGTIQLQITTDMGIVFPLSAIPPQLMGQACL